MHDLQVLETLHKLSPEALAKQRRDGNRRVLTSISREIWEHDAAAAMERRARLNGPHKKEN